MLVIVNATFTYTQCENVHCYFQYICTYFFYNQKAIDQKGCVQLSSLKQNNCRSTQENKQQNHHHLPALFPLTQGWHSMNVVDTVQLLDTVFMAYHLPDANPPQGILFPFHQQICIHKNSCSNSSRIRCCVKVTLESRSSSK